MSEDGGANRWDAMLCNDLRAMIWRHRAALTIQGSWRRRDLFRHARHPHWPYVKAHLGHATWRRLFPYEHVRREWRTEMLSWCYADEFMLDVIHGEAVLGLWGRRCANVESAFTSCSTYTQQ